MNPEFRAVVIGLVIAALPGLQSSRSFTVLKAQSFEGNGDTDTQPNVLWSKILPTYRCHSCDDTLEMREISSIGR